MKTKQFAGGKPVFILATAILFLFTDCHHNDDNNGIQSGKVDIKMIADGLVSPIGVVAPPDNSGRLFIIDQAGKIWIIDASGNKLATPFIDVTSMMVTLSPGYDE